jgi:3-methyladenine DNA glycosylase Mpg
MIRMMAVSAGASSRRRLIRWVIRPGTHCGHTRRNASLFLGGGYAYVYFTYGSSFMLNETSETAGAGAGVRALEPLEGIDRMQGLRSV